MDLDSDGHADVISGSYPGPITWFRREVDRFAGGEVLNHADGKPVNPDYGTQPFAFDWDGDGKFDLIIGLGRGDVLLSLNVGTKEKPAFGEPTPIEAGGKPVVIEWGSAAPVVADWDGDGLPDLIVGGGDGSVVWFRNEGARKAPKLAAAKTLVPPSPMRSRSQDDRLRKPGEWGHKARPAVVDWDGDGKLDLLVGDASGHYQGKPKQTANEAAEDKEATDQLPTIRKEWAAAYKAFAALADAPEPDDPAERKAHAAQLDRARRKVAWLKDELARLQDVREHFGPAQMTHGYVWLFRRIEPAKK